MRVARIKSEGEGFYHCMSRVIERRMILGEREKEFFRKTMRAVEQFCDVQILTYAIMGNHFHVLVRVPEPEQITDQELLRRLALLYSKRYVAEAARRLRELRAAGLAAEAEKFKQSYTYRMRDLSQFMKMLKQRFSQWYNRRQCRRGPLWEQRFKSILVEDSELAISTMATYIDLNAVRAGIVEDPKDYRYCGYGEAVAGNKRARAALAVVMEECDGEWSWRELGRAYRQLLYQQGEGKGIGPEGESLRAGFSEEQVEAVLESGGKLSRAELMHCSVRYLSDGLVLGSREFVESVYSRYRGEFGLKRRSGARRMRGGDWGGLCTMRDLRVAAITVGGRPG